MKKKIITLLCCGLLAFVFAACGSKPIEGTPSDVVEAVRSIPAKKTVSVEVTGEISLINSTDSSYSIYLKDGDYDIACLFADNNDLGLSEGEIAVIKGSFYGGSVSDNSAALINCELVYH